MIILTRLSGNPCWVGVRCWKHPPRSDAGTDTEFGGGRAPTRRKRSFSKLSCSPATPARGRVGTVSVVSQWLQILPLPRPSDPGLSPPPSLLPRHHTRPGLTLLPGDLGPSLSGTFSPDRSLSDPSVPFHQLAPSHLTSRTSLRGSENVTGEVHFLSGAFWTPRNLVPACLSCLQPFQPGHGT